MKKTVRKQVEQELLDNYQKYYRLAYSYVRNEGDALDIVQESAYKALKECARLEKADFINTWIYKIVMNTAADFLRKRQRSVPSSDEFLIQEQGADEEGYAQADIMATLSVLGEKERNVLILRYFEQFQLEQIADITGEKLSTIKSRLYRSLEKLKINLETI